jgi:uncharacterized protein (TIGR02466 family)|tara:strand:+ start:3126 stop:3716 length:591 start_codon:yes stop_codon:yes gene_type:complete
VKHLSTIPICSNALFTYRLDIKDNLVLKFKEEKFKPISDVPSLVSKDLNILKKYKKLNKEINKAVDATLQEILMLKNINYRIFSSWLTKVEPKGYGDSHRHSNSWLSGVYYPKGDPGFSVKFFLDNKSQFFTDPIEYNIFNSSHWTVPAEDNLLILFFSQLRHQIMPNQSTEDRFSLAFNLLPKGEFGKSDSGIIF